MKRLERMTDRAVDKLDGIRERPVFRKTVRRLGMGHEGDTVLITYYMFGFAIHRTETTWQAYSVSNGIESP